jgi:hypothetical protein
MQGTIRPFAATGVAIIGAGAIAVTPLALRSHDVSIAPAYQLSAASDLLAPDPSTLDGAHRNFYSLLPLLKDLGVVQISPTGQNLVNFSTTSLSGLGLGLVGPIAAPVFAIGNDLYKAGRQIPADALATMLNIPVDAAAAFLFGGVHVDITALVKALGPALGLQFPDGIGIGINFGGVFSPAGSAFDSLDFNLANLAAAGLPGVEIDSPLAGGHPAGAIASLGAVIQVLANGVTKVPAFDFPAIGQLFGDVLTGALKNALKDFGLGDLITSLNLGNLFSGALGGLGDTLGGLFGLAAPVAANAVPASVQESLVAGSTVTAKDNKLTASSTATASADAKTAPAKPTLDSVKATPKGSASQPFGSQVSAAAAGFGASPTKGPLKTAKHAKAAASSSKAGAAK